jgi:hypothetical protein
VLSVFLHGYRFGFGNHISELPIVLRSLDADYLANDFYVNASSHFGPRFYFSKLLAGLSQVLPLPWLYLVLTCLGSSAIVLSACVASWKIFGHSRLAALLGGTLVTSVQSIEIGSAARLFRRELTASHLAMPLALLALWAGVRRRPVLCGVLSGCAALLHPTIGIQFGILGLSAIVVSLLWEREREWRRELPGVLLGALPMVLVLLIAWWVPWEPGGSSQRWVELESHFRHPHHAVPTSFPTGDYALFGSFLAAVLLAWGHRFRDPSADRALLKRLLVPVGVILLWWIAGYLFTEVFPFRLWAAARVFRLAVAIKWLGLILLAGTAASWVRSGRSASGPAGWILLVGCGVARPMISLIGILGGRFSQRLPLGWAASWAATVALLLFFGDRIEAILLAILLPICFWIRSRRPKAYRFGVPLAVASIIIGGLFAARAGAVPDLLDPPVILLDDAPSPSVMEFARTRTPADAVFITPPGFGRFRLVARRAIVVDFKSFPFHGDAMEEWYQRLVHLYGAPALKGFAAADEMDRRYRAVTTQTLIQAGSRYGASYAVLYEETPTELEVLYEEGDYKIVRVPASARGARRRHDESRAGDPGRHGAASAHAGREGLYSM